MAGFNEIQDTVVEQLREAEFETVFNESLKDIYEEDLECQIDTLIEHYPQVRALGYSYMAQELLYEIRAREKVAEFDKISLEGRVRLLDETIGRVKSDGSKLFDERIRLKNKEQTVREELGKIGAAYRISHFDSQDDIQRLINAITSKKQELERQIGEVGPKFENEKEKALNLAKRYLGLASLFAQGELNDLVIGYSSRWKIECEKPDSTTNPKTGIPVVSSDADLPISLDKKQVIYNLLEAEFEVKKRFSPPPIYRGSERKRRSRLLRVGGLVSLLAAATRVYVASKDSEPDKPNVNASSQPLVEEAPLDVSPRPVKKEVRYPLEDCPLGINITINKGWRKTNGVYATVRCELKQGYGSLRREFDGIFIDFADFDSSKLTLEEQNLAECGRVTNFFYEPIERLEKKRDLLFTIYGERAGKRTVLFSDSFRFQ